MMKDILYSGFLKCFKMIKCETMFQLKDATIKRLSVAEADKLCNRKNEMIYDLLQKNLALLGT